MVDRPTFPKVLYAEPLLKEKNLSQSCEKTKNSLEFNKETREIPIAIFKSSWNSLQLGSYEKRSQVDPFRKLELLPIKRTLKNLQSVACTNHC